MRIVRTPETDFPKAGRCPRCGGRTVRVSRWSPWLCGACITELRARADAEALRS